jgi:hypothetical protein
VTVCPRDSRRRRTAIDHDLAEHDHLLGRVLLAFGEEAAAGERPGALDRRHHHVGAMHAREPALSCPRVRQRTFSWMPPATYCTPDTLANRVRIVERHRRRRAEAGFEIAER